MNELVQDALVDVETLEDQLESIYHELNLAMKWKRPSILFAIYNSSVIRRSAQDSLEQIILEAGQNVVHFQLEYDQQIDLGKFLDEIIRQGNSILFIDPLHSDGKDSQIDNLISMLNSCRGHLVDNLVRVVFWLTEKEALSVAHQAPDFWASRHRVFEFIHQQKVCDEPKIETKPSSLQVRGDKMALNWTNGARENEIPGESALVVDIAESDDPSIGGINMLLMMGVANWKENNHEKAIESLQAALAIAQKTGNKDHQAMCHKAIALVKSDFGKNQDAIQAYNQVVALGPENVTIWNNMGLLYLKEEKFDDAQKAFSNAIRKEPNDPISWNGLGMVFSSTGRLDDAIGCYRKAIQFNSGYMTPWVKLGDVLLRQNRNEDALYAYMRTVEMDNKNVHAWSEIGNIYFKAGSYEQAVDAFKKALLLGVESPGLHVSLADAFTFTGNYTDAIPHYQKAIAVETDENELAALWNKLGDVHRRVNDYENAVTSYEMADKLTPESLDPEDHTFPEQGLEVMQAKVSPVKNAVAQSESIEKVVVHEVATPMLAQAQELVGKVIASLPSIGQDAQPKAEDHPAVNNVPKSDTKSANLWTRLGNTYLKAGAIDRAIDAYQKAVNLDTTDGQTFWLLAQAYTQKDNLSEAVVYYKKSVDLLGNNSDKALTLSRVGDLFRQMKEYVNALEAFESAIVLDPENEVIISGLCRIQDDLDQLDSPAQQVEPNATTPVTKVAVEIPVSVSAKPEKIIETNLAGSGQSSVPAPFNSNLNNANVWNELGNIFTKSRAYDDAISAYNRAIELNPEYGWAYSNLALIQSRQGKRTEAVNLYHKSIDLLWTDADKSVAWNRLGDVYRQAGQYSDAIDAYQNADRLNQGNYALSAIREVNLDQLFPHFVS
ncbi:MAG: tetratricopeptide repeat protein [Chloroflexota bacterium]